MGSVSIALCGLSLNNASLRTVRKWLTRNNSHLITLQIWIYGDIMSGERRTKLFWNFIRRPEQFVNWESHIRYGTIFRRSRVLEIVDKTKQRVTGNILSIFLFTQVFALYWIVFAQFLITSQLISSHDFNNISFYWFRDVATYIWPSGFPCCWTDVLKLTARWTANVFKRQIQGSLENFPFRQILAYTAH